MSEQTPADQSLGTAICTECGEAFVQQPDHSALCSACSSVTGEQSETRNYLMNYYYLYAD